ncbi:MAG: SPFH domain-containing protein [Candidatus Bathyarchaeota archaeon]|nr:SPFH domain-containing protein [Candidatus Bathyarchaeota archaeon]
MPFLKKKTVSRNVNSPSLDELIWRIPNQAYPKVADIDEIVVTEFEKAVLIKDGVVQNVLSSGKHEVPRGVTEIVWVDISPKCQLFGIPVYNGPTTKDNYQIGLSGTVTFRVMFSKEDVKSFVLEMVKGSRVFAAAQVVDWLRSGVLVSVLRDVVKSKSLDEFKNVNREQLVSFDLRPRLVCELSKYGIELVSMDITGMTSRKSSS